MEMKEIAEKVKAGRARDVCALVQAALDAGTPALTILNIRIGNCLLNFGEAYFESDRVKLVEAALKAIPADALSELAGARCAARVALHG